MKETGVSRRPGRWLRVLLFVSLAFNLLVVGLVIGFVLNGPPKPRGDRTDPVLPYTRAFDQDQQRELRQALRRSFRSEGQGVRDGYLSDYETALELLRADPFDAERIAEVLKAQAARGVDVRQRGQKVLSGYLAAMSPEERRAYADRLEAEVEAMRERGLRWKDRRNDGDRRTPGRD
ncbi:periplasmic heavy metal sensor [Antarctobacter jejuensis]|uniref:periplasmic heavy metal sensor n=1 Tax=Antarctobacter jejuensis TaxID=1439938 RepID=UPI003FD638D5